MKQYQCDYVGSQITYPGWLYITAQLSIKAFNHVGRCELDEIVQVSDGKQTLTGKIATILTNEPLKRMTLRLVKKL